MTCSCSLLISLHVNINKGVFQNFYILDKISDKRRLSSDFCTYRTCFDNTISGAMSRDDEEPAMIDAEEGEEVAQDEDAAMDSDAEDGVNGEQLEIQLQNDSIAHFDIHQNGVFCIAQHPKLPHIVATGGGDDTGYVFSTSLEGTHSQKSAPGQERPSLSPLATLSGHTDTVNALTFTLPDGEFLLSAGLDGQLRAWQDSTSNRSASSWDELGHVREVDEINWVKPCPSESRPNHIAMGASDGSVWIYQIDPSNSTSPLVFVNSFFLHGASCTAGAWTPSGSLLATVAEDGSFFVWDAFSDAAAAGIVAPPGGNTVIGLTAADERFKVEGGLYSIAIAPTGFIAAVGGAEGQIRVVGLPRLGSDHSATASNKGGPGSTAKTGGSKQSTGPKGGDASAGQAGQILANLQAQTNGIETMAFSPNPTIPLLAAGSVDGSIAFFDTKSNFSLRKHLKGAHGDEAVVQVQFIGPDGPNAWTLTSCGYDGVVRRWDARGGANVTTNSMLKEYKGHQAEDEGGGITAFVQGDPEGRYIITASEE